MPPVTHPARSFAAPAALALTGFSAVVGQVVLLRALIQVFNGNEIALGLLLATWLFWTAVGSALASRLRLGPAGAHRAVALFASLLAFALPAALWALCVSRTFVATVPGELLGPLPMLLVSLVCLSLFCPVCGALFVAAARLWQTERVSAACAAAGAAYLLEAAGSGLGGLLASVVFLRFLDPFQTVFLMALLNLALAAALLLRPARRSAALFAGAVCLAAWPLLFWIAPRVDNAARVRQWRGFQLLAVRDTVYGNLAVTGTGPIRSLYDNGILLANAPDPAAAEEAVHYALLEHPAPRRVLLIGGGVNGGVREALRHPTVARLDYVELDPALIGLARQFFPAQTADFAGDPRLHLHFLDGRRFLSETGERFDVILVDVPDPQTAQLNRFYTLEFFRLARAHLTPGGLLALQLRSSEETISPDLAGFLRCIQHTLAAVFPYQAAIPGEILHLFGALEPGQLTRDPRVLIERLRARSLDTQYVREYFLPYRMAPDRMEQIATVLRPTPATPVNRDFAPVAYAYDVLLWSAQFQSRSTAWFRAAQQIPFRRVAGASVLALLLAAGALLMVPGHQRRARSAAGFCAAATGFTLMALQIFLLLAFQALYGYVYTQLAVLIGLFMAGIALGSWLALRRTTCPNRGLAGTQLLLALAAPALLLLASWMGSLSSAPAVWLAAQTVFPALAAGAGLLGGAQFVFAAGLFLRGPGAASGLGRLYALDLLGGCVGALLLSTFLIPVYGFWPTAWITAAIDAAAFLPALLTALRPAIVNDSISVLCSLFSVSPQTPRR